MQCRFCGRRDGSHDTKVPCPEISATRGTDILVWEKGYADGRLGKTRASDDPRYMLGFLHGEAALEEAENGSGWVTYA